MRNHIKAAVAVIVGAVALALPACEPSRPDEEDADAGIDAGKPDAGRTDAGTTDAGTQDAGPTDAGEDYDGGLLTVTLRDVRSGTLPNRAHVLLENVVVTGMANRFLGDKGDYDADFWVTDPADPTIGAWVNKHFLDGPEPEAWGPLPGDVLTIKGWVGNEPAYADRHGRRVVVKSQFNLGGTQDMELTKTGTAPVPPETVFDAGTFGDAQGGHVRANSEFRGARVHILGPLEIVDIAPPALDRISAVQDDDVSFGFEVTGGVLVNNFATFRADGGCPWLDIARDAGTFGQTVVFQGGIKGVWDTYTHAPCADGGTATNCFRNDGFVPGTDAGFTYVLYPLSCDDFVDGTVQ